MYKKLSILVAFFICTFLLGCQKNTSQKPLLIVGTCADYPPFSFQCRGSFEGFEIELSEAIAKQLGRELEIKDMDFPALVPALNAGQVDFVIASLSMTESRKKNIDFSIPYYTVAPVLVVKKESQTADSFSFENKKVGAQLGSTLETVAKDHQALYPTMSIATAPKNLQLIEDLKIGRLDAVIVETQQAIAFTQKNPNLTYLPLEENMTEWAIGIKKDAMILKDINQALATLKANATLRELEDKWLQ